MSQVSFTTLVLTALLGLAGPVLAQTANSSGGAGSATQSQSGGGTAPMGGNTASGSANGQNAQVSSGGTGAGAAGNSVIGPPTAVEREEQRKSDQDTKMICKGC